MDNANQLIALNARLNGYAYGTLETLLIQVRTAGANGMIDPTIERSLQDTILAAFDYRTDLERKMA